jgi:hypothetical protein
VTKEYEESLDPRRKQAVHELSSLIRQRYPAAAFEVEPGEDDPEVTHLTTTVDVDDPDEVVDLVIDRMLELTIDEGIPVYVIPIRAPERVAKLRQEERTQRHPPAVPLFVPPPPPR